jgi:hypothetical protein
LTSNSPHQSNDCISGKAAWEPSNNSTQSNEIILALPKKSNYSLTYYILHRSLFLAVEELVEKTDHNYSSVGCLQRAINCVNKSIWCGFKLLEHTIFPRTRSGTFLEELQMACAPECENMTGLLVTFIAASVVRSDT